MTSRPFKSTQNGRQILDAEQVDGFSLGQSGSRVGLYRRLRGGGGIVGKFYNADLRFSIPKEVTGSARIS